MHVSEVTSVLSNSLQPMYSAHIKLWSRGRGRRANAQGSVSSVQSLSRVRLFATLWTAAHQAFQAFTFSWSLPKCMSVESVMPSNHLILRRPLLLLPSVFPSTRVSSKLWETVRREAWRAAVHGVAKSRTRLSD